jgi:hypothetical protein
LTLDSRGDKVTWMIVVKRALWALSILGSLIGIYIMIQAFRKAPTEQDLADCAMMATACAIVPYCLARAVSGITSE